MSQAPQSSLSSSNIPSRSFAALHHPGFRRYVGTYTLAMMADNIEHVISYWMVFQKFQSPALGGFAVVAHWLPFLLFAIPQMSGIQPEFVGLYKLICARRAARDADCGARAPQGLARPPNAVGFPQPGRCEVD